MTFFPLKKLQLFHSFAPPKKNSLYNSHWVYENSQIFGQIFIFFGLVVVSFLSMKIRPKKQNTTTKPTIFLANLAPPVQE
jgi:hypothetical protein